MLHGQTRITRFCSGSFRYPPWILFYQGDLTLTRLPATGIVGLRRACRHGLAMTERCCAALKDEVIVSGLALGIDGDGAPGAVGGSAGERSESPGADWIVPIRRPTATCMQSAEEKSDPERISAPNAAAEASLSWRNRLIAALSDRIVVMQAGFHSGTMLTVNEALELDREVWCLPYPAMNKEGEGRNLLISQGAELLMDPAQPTRSPSEWTQARENRVKTMKF